MDIRRPAWLVLALAWIPCAPAAEPQTSWAEPPAIRAEPAAFRLETLQQDSMDVLTAHNPGPFPVSVSVRLEATENLRSDVAWPVVAVVPARSSLALGRLFRAAPGLSWTYRYSYSHRLGSFNAWHDPAALYRLPYQEGSAFTISQAPGGMMTTHTSREGRYAVDISMPEGTPVLAARDGIVLATESRHAAGGRESALLAAANFVQVLHADGTFGEYVHLVQGGVAVRTGEAVRAGQILGHSGSTGYSSGPHLHFAVTRLIRDGHELAEVSVPLMFFNGNPPFAFAPRVGLAVTADYASPGVPPSPLRVEPARAASSGVPAGEARAAALGFLAVGAAAMLLLWLCYGLGRH